MRERDCVGHVYSCGMSNFMVLVETANKSKIPMRKYQVKGFLLMV
jgi:hypothetical protein